MEEARFRLGDDETRRLLESDDPRNWPNPYRSKNKLPPAKRETLLRALEEHMTPEEQQRAEIIATIAEKLLRDPAVVKLLGRRRAAR